jgi:hypothetical protein
MTLIMIVTMLTIDVDDACLPVLLRLQRLGRIIVGGIGSLAIVITESLPLQANGGDRWWATMTTTRMSTMEKGR